MINTESWIITVLSLRPQDEETKIQNIKWLGESICRSTAVLHQLRLVLVFLLFHSLVGYRCGTVSPWHTLGFQRVQRSASALKENEAYSVTELTYSPCALGTKLSFYRRGNWSTKKQLAHGYTDINISSNSPEIHWHNKEAEEEVIKIRNLEHHHG